MHEGSKQELIPYFLIILDCGYALQFLLILEDLFNELLIYACKRLTTLCKVLYYAITRYNVITNRAYVIAYILQGRYGILK